MRLAGALAAAFCVAIGLATPVGAGSAPLTSIRPVPRQTVTPVTTRASPVRVTYRYSTRPRPRFSEITPNYVTEVAAPMLASDGTTQQLATTVPVYRSQRPATRPGDLRFETPANSGVSAPVKQRRTVSAAPIAMSGTGRLCGDRRIKGQIIAPIAGTLPGCGVDAPVRVTSIDGVVLSQASIMDCQTAQALTTWVTQGLKPAVGRKGGGVKSLRVLAHYSCRTRNSKPGAKISEHGKGHAIDIAAINLADGSSITVLEGWNSRRQKKLLRKLHSAACGPFGTVLGPDANKYHRDHFHFDTARYRGGPFCE